MCLRLWQCVVVCGCVNIYMHTGLKENNQTPHVKLELDLSTECNHCNNNNHSNGVLMWSIALCLLAEALPKATPPQSHHASLSSLKNVLYISCCPLSPFSFPECIVSCGLATFCWPSKGRGWSHSRIGVALPWQHLNMRLH